jgi:putative molybdopterin biosynthesis protein
VKTTQAAGPPLPEIANNIASLRASRNITAAQLAATVGISRQTVYAMEAGNYVPNTAVALRLARALEVTVEDLFTLAEVRQKPDSRTEQVHLLPGSDSWQTDQPVQLCRVKNRLIAAPAYPAPWSLPAIDAVLTGTPSGIGRTPVRLSGAPREFGNRILLAGCDPGISILSRHLQAAGSDFVIAQRNSSQSLELLKQGCIHIAGTHLRDEATGESNVPAISRMFPRNSIALISFATWEEGMITGPGNPKAIRGIADLARKDVTFINRETGSGSRLLLDSRLKQAGIDSKQVRGYQNVALGHLPAAWQVHTGVVDCCIATGSAARAFGLGFTPLASERYDLAMRRNDLNLPGIQALLDTLNRSMFRRELENIGGYGTNLSGRRVL